MDFNKPYLLTFNLFLDLRVFNYYKVIKLQEKELINVLCQYGWMDGQHEAVH